MIKSAGLFLFSVLYFHRHENTVHLCTGEARNKVPLLTLLTLLLVEHFLVDICFTIVQVSCQKIFLHFTYSFFDTYNAKFSMLQFPYEKGFEMPGFEIFLLTVMCRLSTKLKSLGLQSKRNSAIHKGWHGVNNCEVKIFFSHCLRCSPPFFFLLKKAATFIQLQTCPEIWVVSEHLS